MKKTIVILLLLSTLLCLFSACKEDPAPSQQNTETDPPRKEEITDNLPAKNMDHFELRMMTNSPERLTWGDVIIAPDDYTGEEIYDTMFERNAYIMERFNCELTVTQEQGTTMINDAKIQNLALSGDSATGPHIVMHYDKWIMNSAQYFLDWKDVPYISLNEEYWNPSISNLFEIRGNQVALSGSFSLGMLSRTTVYLFNKEMYEQYFGDISSMYGYVTDNEWTIDKLFEIGNDVVENPDDIWDETDQYGIYGNKKEFYTTLMVGSDIQFLQKDEEGIPNFTLPGDSYAIEKMQKILKLSQDTDAYYDKSTDIHNSDPKDSFVNERTLFEVGALFNIPLIRATMETEFGIVPAPKYNTDQKEFRCISYGGELACLLMTTKEEDFENIGIIMEALSFDSQQKLIPIYKDKLLKTRFASDEDSRAMLDIIFTSTVSELGVNLFEDIVTVPLVQKIFAPKQDVISSTISGMSSVRTEIAKILQKVK